jgi:hypothetical protein
MSSWRQTQGTRSSLTRQTRETDRSASAAHAGDAMPRDEPRVAMSDRATEANADARTDDASVRNVLSVPWRLGGEILTPNSTSTSACSPIAPLTNNRAAQSCDESSPESSFQSSPESIVQSSLESLLHGVFHCSTQSSSHRITHRSSQSSAHCFSHRLLQSSVESSRQSSSESSDQSSSQSLFHRFFESSSRG